MIPDFTDYPVGWAGSTGEPFAFRPNPWYIPPYQRHTEPMRGAILSRGETYTSLAMLRVVRCAWLETFGPKAVAS